ncbi:esterase/lipase family protein [Streptomyces sp. NPDC101116]|uniref:esterase/lipase family protein n=1 Tax=Streptomyces sp. NPDC101116 TaxID=3366107 RepID=UPI00382A5DDB
MVWGTAAKGFDLLKEPERLSTGAYPRLAPAGLVATARAFGMWTVVPGYDRLLARLGKWTGGVVDDGSAPEPDLDAGVVAVGYDFRLGVADAARTLDAQLRQRLEHHWPDERDREARVVIVAHSMGGLVARYWVAELGGAPWCRGIITLGTPHRGAPKALAVLTQGLPVGPFFIRRPLNVVRDWQGLADLLPRYPAVHDRSAAGAAHLPEGGLAPGRPHLLRPHELPLPWLREPARRAHAMHRQIEEGWRRLPVAPAVMPRIGFGHATLRACSWDGSEVTVTKDAPSGPELGGWADGLGDGTVPAFCGLPVEMDNYPRTHLHVHRRHGPIAELRETAELLDAFRTHAALSAYRAGQESPVALGMDLDELHMRDRPIDVAVTPVTLAGERADAARATVWASAEPVADNQQEVWRRIDVRLAWDPGRRVFHGQLPGLPPGLVKVSVTARDLTDSIAVQTVQVLDDSSLE